MSLAIDIDNVSGVLLVDGWHAVDPMPNDPDTSSFDLDAFELGEHSEGYNDFGEPGGWRDFNLAYGGGIGFSFREGAHRVSGPAASILAVRYAISGDYAAPAIDARQVNDERSSEPSPSMMTRKQSA